MADKRCWCGRFHPYKHWVVNWQLYFLRGGEVPQERGQAGAVKQRMERR